VSDIEQSSAYSSEQSFRPDVTVATVICRDGCFLTVEETVRGARVLNQPAGHLEANETLAEAALRETLEETAWEADLRAYLGTYQWTSPSGHAFLRFAFVAEATRHHPGRALDAGIEQVLWLRRDELAAQAERLRSPLVLQVIDDYLAGVRHPLDALRWIGP
jgi:8-oxo-dGTP pyrophosphatase MutT (NUDIX family)